MTKLKCGLIQMALKGDTDRAPEAIRDAMLEAHFPLIDQAGEAGVQVLCFQEVFTQPYFCPSQDAKWYAATEKIPEGPTVTLMRTTVDESAQIGEEIARKTATSMGPAARLASMRARPRACAASSM